MMLNNYDFNHTENNNEMENETNTYQPLTPSGSHNNNKKNPKNSKKLAKKIGAITLSAVLFGSVAAGSFQAVNYFSPFSKTTGSSGSTASNNSSNTSLLKTTAVSGSSNTGSLDVSDITTSAMPSIVAITNKSVQEVQDYFSQFGFGGQGQPQTQETESQGSGIIIGKNDSELLMVTNNHVVEGADTLSVCFIDNQVYEAAIKGTDPENDLAVIAVPLDSISDDTMSKIAVASIGDSDSLKVGEQVVAIGNALGYGQSVTTGIVSAVNRTLSSNSSDTQDSNSSDDSSSATYIQTDAAINPGNSGGALLNMNGEVIGINSAKLASTEVEGMGYAIAISDVTDTLEQLMNETPRDKVDNHGVLGITGMSVSDEASQYYGVPEGVLVSEVTDGGVADKAGIKEKSIITEFDGKRVRSIDELVSRLEYYEPGEEVEVTLEVADGDSYKEKKVTVTLGENPDADSSDSKDTSSKDDAQAEDSQDDSQDQEDQSTDSLLQDFENQQADGTAYEQFFGFLN